MKTIIAGSRDFNDYHLLSLICCQLDISEVVSGGARGADTLGECYAKENDIPVKEFLADWTKLGKRAGYVRNKEMAEYAQQCVCFWDGISPGTRSMIDLAYQNELKVVVINYNQLIATSSIRAMKHTFLYKTHVLE